MEKTVEICCGSYYDALQASQGGAKRIELNSALYMGGLTPSLATLKLVKQNTDLSVMVMIRPRGAGFCYNKEDFETMLLDANLALTNGADGIVFGCLTENNQIHVEQCLQMLSIIKDFGKQAVFHRAFDCVKDVDLAMENIIDLGFDRILTSGLAANVTEGKEQLKQLQEKYGTRIELLAGCGINAYNAKEIMRFTGLHQIHSSCKCWKSDPTTIVSKLNYSYAGDGHESEYDQVDEELVKKLIQTIN